MSLYHFHVGQVKRSAGHTAIAAAAYRSGTKLHCDYYGEDHDYTKKGGVIFSEILLPEHAPEKYMDRETLWNAVEVIEKHPKAQLAYNFDIALQNELSMEENIALARAFIQSNFIAKGMLVDWAVHQPDKGEDGIQNPHFHVIAPIRPILTNGEWGDKQHREYIFDENGVPVIGADGKQKFNSIQNTDWGKPETLDEWRKNWADMVNAEFERKGIGERIDHRSYKDQELDLIPQVHEGSAVRKMEQKGIVTEKGELNRWIKKTNKAISDILRAFKKLSEWYEAVKSELKVMKQPTVMELVNEYISHRNRVADTYDKGRQKAKNGNLKMQADIYNFILENKLDNTGDLGLLIAKKQKEVEAMKVKQKETRDTIKAMDDILDDMEHYEELRAVNEKYNSIFFKGAKEKYGKAHAKELIKFRMLRRKVCERISDGNPETAKLLWIGERNIAKQNLEKILTKHEPLSKEYQMLKNIRKAVDYALEQRNEAPLVIPDIADLPSEIKQSVNEQIQSFKPKVEQSKQKTADKSTLKGKSQGMDL